MCQESLTSIAAKSCITIEHSSDSVFLTFDYSKSIVRIRKRIYVESFTLNTIMYTTKGNQQLSKSYNIKLYEQLDPYCVQINVIHQK